MSDGSDMIIFLFFFCFLLCVMTVLVACSLLFSASFQTLSVHSLQIEQGEDLKQYEQEIQEGWIIPLGLEMTAVATGEMH